MKVKSLNITIKKFLYTSLSPLRSIKSAVRNSAAVPTEIESILGAKNPVERQRAWYSLCQEHAKNQENSLRTGAVAWAHRWRILSENAIVLHLVSLELDQGEWDWVCSLYNPIVVEAYLSASFCFDAHPVSNPELLLTRSGFWLSGLHEECINPKAMKSAAIRKLARIKWVFKMLDFQKRTGIDLQESVGCKIHPIKVPHWGTPPQPIQKRAPAKLSLPRGSRAQALQISASNVIHGWGLDRWAIGFGVSTSFALLMGQGWGFLALAALPIWLLRAASKGRSPLCSPERSGVKVLQWVYPTCGVKSADVSASWAEQYKNPNLNFFTIDNPVIEKFLASQSVQSFESKWNEQADTLKRLIPKIFPARSFVSPEEGIIVRAMDKVLIDRLNQSVNNIWPLWALTEQATLDELVSPKQEAAQMSSIKSPTKLRL